MRPSLHATIAAVLLAAAAPAPAQPASPGAVAAWRRDHEHALLAELAAFAALPNVAADSAGIRANAAHLLEMMERRGLSPRLLDGAGGAPALYGEWRVPGATRTLVLYAHYDGQPADPAGWRTTHPWRPALFTARHDRGGREIPLPAAGTPIDPEWRLYGRSSADDKAGVLAILAAVDALLALGVEPTSNLKFYFDGEEEAGSPHLEAVLRANADLLAADAWIIADGPVHTSGRKQVVFGVRGDANVELTVYGPERALHSGHYGNWAPNPAHALAVLLAGMKDEDGRVTIAGWYDDVEPWGDAERAAVAALPADDRALMEELGIARPEAVAPSLFEAIALPSLNVNGIESGALAAGARNVVPAEATTVLDLRLVLGNHHARQVERLRGHLLSRGYHLLDRAPTPGERRAHPRLARLVVRPGAYDAERTPMDLPLARAVLAAVRGSTDEPVYAVPTLGGSLPLSVISATLGTRTITVPVVNHDNNQHADDENLRLGNLWAGIETYAALLSMPR
jgi:acetylornithine deacetylase/succinyl-diaminopimelate desuccinylase-like protein